MSIQSVIQPLRPIGEGWQSLGPVVIRTGYPCDRWHHAKTKLNVMSAVEVASDKDGIDRGPEYHISVSRWDWERGKAVRCSSHDAKWVLQQFQLEGAEEDNHVPGGVVRNFWRTVAEPMIGLQCECKADEPAIREDKGDFVWRPA
jgi:hypothetical protein